MFGAWGGDAFELAIGDLGLLAMNAGEQVEGGARARRMALGLQPHAHDAVEDESEEADHPTSTVKPLSH